MRRTTWTGVFTVAFAVVLVSPPAHANGPGASANQPASRAIAGTTQDSIAQGSKAVPVIADQQVSRGSGQPQSTGRLYRDSLGRTRVESGSQVTITDPASGTTLRLDLTNQTYQKLNRASAAPRKAGAVSTNATLASAPRRLGTAQLHGVAAEGRTYTVTIPARQGMPARTKQVSLWLSAQAQLPVELRVTDGSGDAFVQSYTNITTGVEPAAALFGVPAGFREARFGHPGFGGSGGARVNQTCPVFNEPDPLVLNSYDVLLGAGAVVATTDPQIGCFFAADAAVFEYPLAGFPNTPLGLPFDQWIAYDTGGGGLPFLPWVAFGDIAFLATNGTDTTTKDSLVVLTVWCC